MKPFARIVTVTLSLLFLSTGIATASGELKPFPQGVTFPGCLKPSIGQSALNSQTLAFYNNNYKQYINTSSPDGQYYIEQDGNGITTSEAHGYGMMIMALMAGSGGEPNAHDYFDGLLKFAINHPSNVNDTMMNWAPTSVSSNSQNNCATDGDMDIAYALILADRQWGSDGTYNYLALAKEKIKAIVSVIFDPQTKRITTDDWSDAGDYATRSSDWIIDHVRAYAAVDPTIQSICDAVIAETYECVAEVADANTGLVSDFVTDDPAVPDANAAGTGERHGDAYSYNGCRFPWRIAMDYIHYGNTTAKAAATKVANWAFGETNGNFADLGSGYSLDGSSLVSYGGEREFVAPMAVAAMVSGDQTMVDNAWESITNCQTSGGTGVYSNGVGMLCMLAASGNWWNPIGSQDPNLVTLSLTASNGGSITNSTGKTTFDKTAATAVTLTAVPVNGFTFDTWTGDIGSAIATNNTITVTMDTNRSISAKFVSTSTAVNLIPTMTWKQNADALGSGADIDSTQKQAGTISAQVTTVMNANSESYASMGGEFGGNLAGATMLHITYSASKPFWFALDNSADCFGMVLPQATNNTLDIEINNTNFKRPSWSTAKDKFNLSTFKGVILDPVTDNDDVSSGEVFGTITLTNLSIDGFTANPTLILPTSANSVAKASIGCSSPDMISVTVPQLGSYHLAVYGMNGRMVQEFSTQFKAGVNNQPLTGISTGTYVVRLSGPVSITGKISITR